MLVEVGHAAAARALLRLRRPVRLYETVEEYAQNMGWGPRWAANAATPAWTVRARAYRPDLLPVWAERLAALYPHLECRFGKEKPHHTLEVRAR